MFDEQLMKIGNTLVGYCKEGKEARGLEELYAEDAVSVEAVDIRGEGAEAKGRAAIQTKHDWWANAFTVHEGVVDGPYLHGANKFGIIFAIDATNNESGDRSKMQELGLYTVENGKIVREEFYFHP